jgi:hypothetical protein
MTIGQIPNKIVKGAKTSIGKGEIKKRIDSINELSY